MITPNKLKQGMTVFVLNINNAARWSEQKLDETRILSVGRKFFVLDEYQKERFFIDTLISDGCGYSPNYKVYLSKYDYDNEIECNRINKKIEERFRYGKSDLDIKKLKEIENIIDKKDVI